MVLMLTIANAVKTLPRGSGIMLWSLQGKSGETGEFGTGAIGVGLWPRCLHGGADAIGPDPARISRWTCILLGWSLQQCNIQIPAV